MYQMMVVTAALSSLYAVACTPDLQPAYPCAPDLTAPYAESPAGLVTPRTEQIVATYLGLSGEWQGDLQCPAGSADSGGIAVDFRTPAADGLRVVTGPDLEQEGIDCHNAGTVLGDGEIAWTGAALGQMSGRSALLEARLGEKGIVGFRFDVSSTPEFAVVEGLLIIEADLSVRTLVAFGFQPQATPGGSMSQQGYNCTLSLTGRR